MCAAPFSYFAFQLLGLYPLVGVAYNLPQKYRGNPVDLGGVTTGKSAVTYLHLLYLAFSAAHIPEGSNWNPASSLLLELGCIPFDS